MGQGALADGIAAGRLSAEEYAANFSDLHPPLAKHEATVEADRCYFCFDAPCMNACPTEIDIPLFIREIATGNPLGAAETIFEQNILGGMCARVCPTEQLCEEACVREAAEGKPVKIGQLQRYATDAISAALFRNLASDVGVTTQDFVVRNDMPCGSTIGPISASRLGLSTVDVGNPMLAMHSAREMASALDVGPMIRVMRRWLET